MIIFGWGHQSTKNIGPTLENSCSHCNNKEYWILNKITTWFTLFFIPIFPYSIKHFLSCPICQYGSTLNNQQIEKIKPLAVINQLLIEGRITKAEYTEQINSLNNGSSDYVKTETVKPKKLIGDNNDVNFCSECGIKITKKTKFCGGCGAKIIRE